MIKRNEIVVKSKFGKTISSMLLSHEEGSRNLAVLFPGGDNSTDVPTLHYARKAALLAGCDTISLEYGSTDTEKEEILKIVIDESLDVLSQINYEQYAQLFFISKSMGHFVSFNVHKRLNRSTIRHICYTPLTKNVDDIAKRECIVFTGTKDKFITKESIALLIDLPNIDLTVVEEAVHSLEINDDYKASIRILGEVTDKCADYIIKHTL